jgi:glycosyltransferase involved in cell wall biosynthesis
MGNMSEQGGAESLNVMVLTSDRYPPIRPAAKAIFGEEFTSRGHRVDWLMQAADASIKGGKFQHGNGWVFLASIEEGSSRLHRLKKYILDFVNDLRVFPLARKNRYDVIQAKDKYVAAMFCWLAARISGSKFCFWLAYPHAEANLFAARHGLARYRLLYWFRGWYRSVLLYRFLLPRADHIFVQSEQMRSDIAAKGIDPEMMTPVPGSLNLESVPYRKDDDPGPEGPIILYVGTLIRIRRLDFVIRVFAKVLEQIPDARLLFVGKGQSPEDEELLHQEVRTQKIEPSHVTFVGHVPIDDVWQYVERSAVCLSPYYPSFTLNSTSPTKLIEYMAMARPVVGNAHPEQSLIIAESEAGLCLPWDETAFADGITDLLGNPQKARKMGINGRRWVEQNRTNARMADVVESRYLALLDKSDHGGQQTSGFSGSA